MRFCAASPFRLALLIGIGSAFAQSGDLRPRISRQARRGSPPLRPMPPRTTSARPTNSSRRRRPSTARPETRNASGSAAAWCVLMWRDDLDTAFRHLDLYDRFGCPGGHVQATFRCLTRFGARSTPRCRESLNGRVHACWINPGAQPQAAAAAATAPRPRPPAPPRRPLPRRPPAPAAGRARARAGEIIAAGHGTIRNSSRFKMCRPQNATASYRVVKSRGRDYA